MRKVVGLALGLSALATMSLASGASKPASAFHSLTIGDITVNEASGLASFVLTIDPPPDASEGEFFRITTTTKDGTATTGNDFVSRTETIDWPVGNSTATRRFDVSILGDNFVEPTESFDVLLSDPVAGCTIGRCPQPVLQYDELAIGTIQDAVPLSRLSINDVRDATKDGDCLLPVTLTPATTIQVSVHWQASSAGVVGDALSGDLVFPPGSTERAVVIDVVRRPQHTKSVDVTLSAPDGAAIEDGSGTCTVEHRHHHHRRRSG